MYVSWQYCTHCIFTRCRYTDCSGTHATYIPLAGCKIKTRSHSCGQNCSSKFLYSNVPWCSFMCNYIYIYNTHVYMSHRAIQTSPRRQPAWKQTKAVCCVLGAFNKLRRSSLCSRRRYCLKWKWQKVWWLCFQSFTYLTLTFLPTPTPVFNF